MLASALENGFLQELIMRNWVIWCFRHKLDFVVYVALILIQFPLDFAMRTWEAFILACKDTKNTFQDIKLEKGKMKK